MDQATIDIAFAEVKPSSNSLEIYIGIIMKSHHPIRLYATFNGLCTQDIALLHGIERPHYTTNVPSIYKKCGSHSTNVYTG